MRRTRRQKTREPWVDRMRPAFRATSRVLAGMAFAALLVLGVSALGRVDTGSLWQIQRIDLQGDQDGIGILEVERALGERPRGFFALDLDEVHADLAALPWVESAHLRKRWPDTLEVRVTRPIPVARWGHDRLVDRHGDVFGPVDIDEWEFLPALQGENGRQVHLMHRYLDASARLADAGLGVAGVRESARHAWTIQLEGGGQVLMGRDPDLARLDQLVALMPVLRARRQEPLSRVDLRYPRGVSVAWQPSEADAEPEATNP